jgi:hypothetical protein
MKIIDILIAIIAPLFIPIFNQLLNNIGKPNLIRKSASKTGDVDNSDVSTFMKELPTAFIGNAIWGMTYRLGSNSYDYTWTIVYCFIALFSCIPILYSRGYKNSKNYKRFIWIGCFILFVIAIIRIFNLFNGLGNISQTT